MAIMQFQVPATTTNQFIMPCSSAKPTILQAVEVKPVTQRNGYTYTGKITLRGIDYQVTVKLTQAGDEMSGTVDTKRIDNDKLIQNVLPPQPTAFPTMPNSNIWDRIKFSGINDYVTLIVDSNFTLSLPSGPRNKSITVGMSFTVIDTTLNKSVDSDNRPVELKGSDEKGWNLPKDIGQFHLAITNAYETAIYGKVIGLYFDYDAINVSLSTNSVQISGKLQYWSDKDGVMTTKDVMPFSSNYESSIYNKKFPWSNKFTIFDSLNLSQGVISTSSLLPSLPQEYQIVLMITITGKGL